MWHFAEGLAQERESFSKESLFGAQPEGTLSAGGQKAGAVGAGFGGFFPTDGVTVLVGSAAAIFAVFGADAMAVLSDFAGDPVLFGEGADHVADQLRLADAASMAADNDEAPILFLRCR